MADTSELSAELPTQSDPETPDPAAASVECLKLIDVLSKQIRAVSERLNGVDMPSGPKERLATWQRALEQQQIATTDWSNFKHDIDEVFQYVDDSQAFQEYRYHEGRQFGFLSTIFENKYRIKTSLEAIDSLPPGALELALQSNQRARGSEHRETAPKVESREPIVAICHGHSTLYLQPKDFLEDRHGVETTYFEQESRTGRSMKEFLTEFGGEATHAVAVLTADDLQADGNTRGRQNVVHEIGYFQGLVGFDRVAVLVQEGVEAVSNIDGIVPIRFHGHRIEETFIEIERWLEREGCPRKSAS